MKTCASHQKGFTLAELLVTTAIIALMAAISVPFYQSINYNLNLNAAGRDLASDLRYAQQMSVTTQVNYAVILDLSGNSYSVVNTETGAVLKERAIKSPIRIMSITGLPSDTVTFNATGAVTSTGIIILTNPNNRQSTIDIKPSGYVKIY